MTKRPMTEGELRQAIRSLEVGEKKFIKDHGKAYRSLKKVVDEIDVGDFSAGAVRQALLTLLAEDTRDALKAGITRSEIDIFDKDIKDIHEIEGLPE